MRDERKQIEAISGKEDFLVFLNDLIANRRENPEEWENTTIEYYLEAMASWIEDFSTSKYNDIDWENVDYVTMAKILYMGKIYE